MNHAALTDAVRASELLAPTRSERHGVYVRRAPVPATPVAPPVVVVVRDPRG